MCLTEWREAQWARRRAEAIATGQSGQRIDVDDQDAQVRAPKAGRGGGGVGTDWDECGAWQTPASSVRWGRTAQILGGLESDREKVAAALVALFHQDV